MSSAVQAILDGFDYQAFWFWHQVCELLRHEPDVAAVGFEVDEYVAFDDVAVKYTRPVSDSARGEITGKFYSVKHSVTFEKEITADSLSDPKLINAKSVSLLERLRDAVTRMQENGESHLFVLAAPWGLKQGDPIIKLVDRNSGRIRLEALFDGSGARAEMGKLRSRWTKLLELPNEEALRPILSRLRFDVRVMTVEVHTSELSVQLAGVGLAPIRKSDPVIIYFPLAVSLRRTGDKWFNADKIRRECEKQNLLQAKATPARKARQLGVRSFLPFTAGLGEKVDHLLCVMDQFDGRTPISSKVWQDTVPKQVSHFLAEHLIEGGVIDLHLHCFGSIAFLCGYLAEPGFGASVGIVQRQYGKQSELWTVDLAQVGKTAAEWEIEEHRLGDGGEWAAAVSVTHDTGPKVIEYCRTKLSGVGRVLIAKPRGGPSFTAVTSGTHAFALAEQFKNQISGRQKGAGSLLHLFWAAPNSFAFYLGQVSRPLGRCLLHEFDFETGGYSPSLEVNPGMRLAPVSANKR